MPSAAVPGGDITLCCTSPRRGLSLGIGKVNRTCIGTLEEQEKSRKHRAAHVESRLEHCGHRGRERPPCEEGGLWTVRAIGGSWARAPSAKRARGETRWLRQLRLEPPPPSLPSASGRAPRPRPGNGRGRGGHVRGRVLAQVHPRTEQGLPSFRPTAHRAIRHR